MADIIQLLPDSIANQIAAGEVIQRPASVVKELLENAVDAAATEIKLIVKDAGKTLIQTVDNGIGMSATDARLSFERHATSKIKKSEDLFTITTKGFRGEALASIAAIAMVELTTRNQAFDVGTKIQMEASVLKKQEAIQMHIGSSFSVRNLFYNVPARRKFLKSDPVELKHIIDEFLRVTLAHPEIFFTFHHNDQEMYHLPKGNLRQRITNIFGNNYNEKIVPVQENTDQVKVYGFTGKPEAAKKTKGEQFLFVNQRYIKSPYLNHAIRSCYDGIISDQSVPFYVLFLDLDPSQIDVNVHPTKTEIKFEEERLIYNYVKVSIRHALGQYHVTPAIDFQVDYNFARPVGLNVPPSGHHKNPVESPILQGRMLKNEWQSLYEVLQTETAEPITVESKMSQKRDDLASLNEFHQKTPYQIHNKYILTQIRSGILLIDQQAAHERILYEKYLKAFEKNGLPAQKQLFPQTIELNPSRSSTLQSILPEINTLGFEIISFGKNTFVIHSIPSGLEKGINPVQLIEALLEQFESNLEFQLGIKENLSRSLATSTQIKSGVFMNELEMKSLIDQLFACSVPYKSPSGKKCFFSIELEELLKKFSA
ncbi:MAG TPA: DNA mismatch repair endonuclease MutL [Saprospiraceae bacterium]|nr:DNA mismatch repair endonuclease MutL [Saprospiraceae bacterium]